MEFNFISSQEALIDKRLLEEISILYNQSFPDVNEREDFYTVLLPRIDSDLIPTTKMEVAKIGDKVAGCAFIDYYQEINFVRRIRVSIH